MSLNLEKKEKCINDLIDAFINFDTHEINYILKSNNINLNDKYISECHCGCKTNISPMDTFYNGTADVRSLQYLIESDYINKEDNILVDILYNLLSISGAENVSNHIDFLLNYISNENPQTLIDYKNEYGCTLLHATLYGRDLDEHINRWFFKLIDIGCNIHARTYEDKTCDFITQNQMNICNYDNIVFTQGILDIAISRINYTIIKFCIENGCSVNIYDCSCNEYNQNLLLKMLYDMRTTKSQEYISDVYKICKILLENDIDLKHTDIFDLNASNYLQLFRWDTTNLYNLFQKYELPDPVNINKSKMKKLKSKKGLLYDDNRYFNNSPFYNILMNNMYIKTDEEIENISDDIKNIINQIPKKSSKKWNSYNNGECQDRISDIINDFDWISTNVGIDIDKFIYN